jgi:pre-mRNA-splicing helicase BRR2
MILLHSHFSRIELISDFVYDLKLILDNAIRLCHALVDIINSNCWFLLAVKAISLSQMIV